MSCWPSENATRSTTSAASRTTSTDPRGGDRAAAARPGGRRRPRGRGPARLGLPARPRERGGVRVQGVHRPLRPLGVRGGDRRSGYAERWRSKSLLGFTAMTSSPWRFHAHLLELWEEADPDLLRGRAWDEVAALRAAMDELDRRRDRRWGAVHGLRFRTPSGRGRPCLPHPRPLPVEAAPRRRRTGDRLANRLRPARGRLHRVLGAVVPAARRRGRARAHALAAHDRAVGAPGEPALRRPAGELARRRHQSRPRALGEPPARARVMPSRRDQIKMSDEEVAAFLAERKVMQCATIGPTGRPHMVASVRARRARAAQLDLRQVAEGQEPGARPARHHRRGGGRAPRAARCDDGVRRADGARDGARRGVRARAGGPLRGGAEEAKQAFREQAKKRVGLRFVATRVVSWDHTKLGGVY